MIETKKLALPQDIVQLSGTMKTGRVLDWSTQRPINARQLTASHYPVQPVSADGQATGEVVFWPQNGIVVIKRHIEPQRSYGDEFELKF